MSKIRRKPSLPPQESRVTGAQAFLDPAICLVLVVATLFVYAQVSRFEFIHYDDPAYVTPNGHTQDGLTLDDLRWAFGSQVMGNWAPLTQLSHLLVRQFFHLESGMHHLINVLFHILATLLLFVVLKRSTGDRWPSAFVAMIFAVHPLHVESVAWVSERKDVLSAFFFFLALYAYVRYAEQPTPRRYLLMVLPFCLGLMSKSMAVTFPFALLLFDIWPLRRVQVPRILWEKLPLIALSAIASVVAFMTQRAGDVNAVIPLALRVENSLISYVTYIGQMFWPTGLAIFYPFPESIAVWKVAAAFAVLLCLTGLAIFTWRTRPYFATGWFWYLGTLVPVIGLVQVGGQAHADRYSYIPMVGFSIILAWGAADVIKRRPHTQPVIALAAAASGLACMALASTQVAYWQDAITLFQHATEVTGNNAMAKYNLALEHNFVANDLMNSGHRAEAIAQFEAALADRPDWAEVHNDLGTLLANVPGRSSEAVEHFASAVRLNPDLVQAQRNLGVSLSNIPGKAPEAIAHLEAAQRIHPDPQLMNLIHRLQAQDKPGAHP